MLCTKAAKEAYVEPVVEGNSYHFTVKLGKPNDPEAARNGTKLARGANFRCLMSGVPIEGDYIKSEGRAGRMGARLMAIVVEGERGRVYLAPTPEHESIALKAKPAWKPEIPLANDPRALWTPPYGLTSYGDLFTNRQLVALNTFSDLIGEARGKIMSDGLIACLANDNKPLGGGGAGARSYAESICIYLSFALDKVADRGSSIGRWDPTPTQSGIINTFSRQGIPMTWNFAESNPLGAASGNLVSAAELVSKVLDWLPATRGASALQLDASKQALSSGKIVSTDPPYYDNIGYADLSDFFYIWLRRSLRDVFPELFATLTVPKAEELFATPYRHGSKDKAELFFLNGMTNAMRGLAVQCRPEFPATIYYAFKQSETKRGVGTASTGWETFLAAVLESGFAVTGTWPMRTELVNRMNGAGTNALASSVVLVCQRRSDFAIVLSRNDFRRQLRQALPKALKELERANIAPVDVAQAAIGPGMAIYSSAKSVLNPDDSPMSVRDALIEINTALDEYLSQDEGELDADSRFALTFFESYGYEERSYGDAEGLAIARNLSVDGVAEAGILSSVAGKVRLYQRAQLPEDWDPTTDRRLCVWEATQHLIKRLEASGEGAAAELLVQLKNVSGHGDLAANCRALAYRLYNHCEKKKQAEEARSYNGLVIAWPELERLASASSTSSSAPRQTTLI
jgi:putative DNA methylase